MIEKLLPSGVYAAEAFGDPPEAYLLPAEAVLVAGAVDKRRREFTTGRHLARQALSGLGYGSSPLLSGPRREPCWPAGVVGSITHCDGYRAAVVAGTDRLATVGIDAEPDEALPPGVLDMVAGAAEREMLHGLRERFPGTSWDRLLFSIKESVYKAWFPLAGRWLGFEEALVTVDPVAETFEAKLLVPGPDLGAGGRLDGFSGRWLAGDGVILAVIAVPVEDPLHRG
ncbi:MAG: 4'-phosphopantetheinyl transferase family protein [Micromonosporaceae bacterium]